MGEMAVAAPAAQVTVGQSCAGTEELVGELGPVTTQETAADAATAANEITTATDAPAGTMKTTTSDEAVEVQEIPSGQAAGSTKKAASLFIHTSIGALADLDGNVKLSQKTEGEKAWAHADKVLELSSDSEVLKNLGNAATFFAGKLAPETDTTCVTSFTNALGWIDISHATTGTVKHGFFAVYNVIKIITGEKTAKAILKGVGNFVLSLLKSIKNFTKTINELAGKDVIVISESQKFISKGLNKAIKIVIHAFAIYKSSTDAVNTAKYLNEGDVEVQGKELRTLAHFRNAGNALKIAFSVSVIALSVIGLVGMVVAMPAIATTIALTTMISLATITGFQYGIESTMAANWASSLQFQPKASAAG